PGGSSSSHSPAMAAWCVSAKSSASWRVTHGLNQPHEHFAQVPRVMWLTKMRLCSFIGVSRSGGGFGRPVEVVAERVGGLAGRVAHLGAVAAGALADPPLGKLVGGGEVMGVGDHGRFLSCCLVRTTLLVSRHPVKCPVLNGSVRYSAAVASAARNLPMQFSFNHRSSAGVIGRMSSPSRRCRSRSVA